MQKVNLIKWLRRNKQVDEILKQGYKDYSKQSTFGRKIGYKDWKRRFFIWILFYLSEIDSLLSFIEELNKRITCRRKSGFRKSKSWFFQSFWKTLYLFIPHKMMIHRIDVFNVDLR